MDDRDLTATPARRGTATVVWLSAAGVAVLALGIVIGGALGPGPATPVAAPFTTSPQVGSAPTTAPTPGSFAPAQPGATWLADLAPVDSSSIDDAYVESPWTAAAAQVAGVTYPKSVSADGAWCASAQLTFALDGRYTRFTAHVAIAEDSWETKPLNFYVLVDGQRVGEVADVGAAPHPVDVPVTGAARLTIGVEPPAADAGRCPGPERVGVWADPALTPAG